MDSTIRVRPARLDDIPLLDALGTRPAGTHRRRLSLQRAGVVVYLVARLDDQAAGHLMLAWAGASEQAITAHVTNCPTIIDLYVAPDLRCRGIGSRLLAEAERRAGERGYPRIGLAVGRHNTRAQALYERQGYSEAGVGSFTATWTEIGENGDEMRVSETCVYLVKPIPTTASTHRYRDRPDRPAAGDGLAGARR